MTGGAQELQAQPALAKNVNVFPTLTTFTCHLCVTTSYTPSIAYKFLNEDNREGIVQTLWNSRFAAIKRLPGRHRALSSTNTIMRSRDPIVTIAHPASTIRPGQRFDSTLLSCKSICQFFQASEQTGEGVKDLHINCGGSPSRLSAGKPGFLRSVVVCLSPSGQIAATSSVLPIILQFDATQRQLLPGSFVKCIKPRRDQQEQKWQYISLFNLLKLTCYVTHQQFNIQQLYALPTLYLCVLYLSENKQRLVPLTA